MMCFKARFSMHFLKIFLKLLGDSVYLFYLCTQKTYTLGYDSSTTERGIVPHNGHNSRG